VETATNAKPVRVNIFRPNHYLTFHSPRSTIFSLTSLFKIFQDLSQKSQGSSPDISQNLKYNAKSKFIADLIGELSAELAQFHSDRIRPKNILKASDAERPRAPNRI
jgi:hypothetical protein